MCHTPCAHGHTPGDNRALPPVKLQSHDTWIVTQSSLDALTRGDGGPEGVSMAIRLQ